MKLNPDTLKEHKFEIFFIIAFELMLIMPVLCKTFLIGDETPLHAIAVAVAVLPICLIFSAIRNYWVFAILCLPLVYLTGNETFVTVCYHNYMRAGNVLAMMFTTSGESKSFLTYNINGIIIYDVVVFLIWIVALVMKWKALKTPMKDTLAKHWMKYLGTSLCVFVISLGFYGITRSEVEASSTTIFKHFVLQPPYNLPYQFYDAWNYTKQRDLSAQKSKGMLFHATHKATDDREIYVMAIGESCMYDHLSLAGYGKKTTPLLDKRAQLALYEDYLSTATLTMLSAPMMMSRATPEDFFTAYSEKNVISVFKECGFKVFVLVCRNDLDDDTYLTSDADSVYHLDKDIEIPAKMDSLATIYPKVMFVAQVLGNHCYYYNFEKEDDIFHQNLYDDDWQSKGIRQLEALINAYDCTIHYTDRVLDGIINALDRPNTRSVLLFASDHGEVLKEGGNERGMSMTPKRGEYHVPLIFWYSDRWAQENTDNLKNMLARKKTPVCGDNLFYTFCDLANVTLPKEYAKPEWSIASRHFKEHQRKLLCPDCRTVITVD